MINRSSQARRSGQILPLFALFLVALCAMAAIAIDISGAYSARRAYRSAADAASLAGAQDLQVPNTRSVTANERKTARQHAMASLISRLGITGALPAACVNANPATPSPADVDVTDTCTLPGTDYHVSIRAGVYPGQLAPIVCVTCNPSRSVQVDLRNADYQLSFARVLGQASWNVGVNSVAGLAYGRSYTIQTLKPPETGTGGLPTVRDIEITGGSIVNVVGDVGTNANMVYGGGSVMNIAAGYGFDWFDPVNPQFWSGPPSQPAQDVQKLPTLMSDPNYFGPPGSGAPPYPAMSGSLGVAPTFTDVRESSCKGPAGSPGANPEGACSRADLDPAGCGVEAAYVLASVYTTPAISGVTIPSTQPLNTFYCYQPGIYDTSNPGRLHVGSGSIALLVPGAYYFKSPQGQLDVDGWLLGGYRPAPATGVALMFDECNNACTFKSNSSPGTSLNAGTKFPSSASSGTSALAARDWNNQPVQTSGPSSPTPPILITLIVRKDSGCYVPVSPQPLIEPGSCNDSNNKTINLFGNGTIILEGVQYAPTDNIQIGGSSSSAGRIGQIIAWTVKYAGGVTINQQGAGSQGPGTLRLDAACTLPSGTPGSVCSP